MADINSLIALGGGGLQQFDLAKLGTSVLDMEGKRVSNDTAAFNLNQGFQRQEALSNYDTQQRAGNPNALNELNTQPTEMSQIVQARSAMSVEDRAKLDYMMGHRAKAAWNVAQYPADSPERLSAWNSQLSELLANRAITDTQYRQLYGQQPSDLLLKQYIDAGRAVPTWAQEQGRAGDRAFGTAAVAAVTGNPVPAPATGSAARPAPVAPTRGPVVPSSDETYNIKPLPDTGVAPTAAAPARSPTAAPASAAAPSPAVAATPPAAAPAARLPSTVKSSETVKPAFEVPVGVPMPGNPRLEQLLPAAMTALATDGISEGTKKLAEIVVSQAMKSQELTPDERQYVVDMKQRAFLRDPAMPFMPLGEWMKEQNAKKATNVSQTVEAAGGKKLAEALSKRYIDAQKEGLESASTVRLYETMDKILDDPNVYTGTAGNEIATLKKLGTTLLGLNLKGVANAEVAKKITDELALSFKKESADPSTSNFERKIYERMATGLTDSAAGRKLLVAMRVGDLAYKAEVAKTFREHLKENGDVDPRVDDALVKLAEKRREKLGEFLEQAHEVASAATQPPPTAGIDQKYIDALFKKFNLPGRQ